MHLIPDNNQTMQNEDIVLYDSVFCPMTKISSNSFTEKWKSINKKNEFKIEIGKVFTNKESLVIKRLQAYHIMICCFKVNQNVTNLYVCCTTRDNTLIIGEIILTNNESNESLTAALRYKSERLTKESELELLFSLILSDVSEEENEVFVCR